MDSMSSGLREVRGFFSKEYFRSGLLVIELETFVPPKENAGMAPPDVDIEFSFLLVP
ncbi:hypothetical protein SDC9_157383 [bioreactor metagenome]|uniref:Uncharacterized protein n=1 Tax=bioreactor metagenome TaxID=1076179 RepID=A0A645F863_9ZZZZ